MSIITTYLKDNAQTPLNRFIVYLLYSQLCNKYSDKSNRWNLGISLSVASRPSSAVGAIGSSRRRPVGDDIVDRNSPSGVENCF